MKKKKIINILFITIVTLFNNNFKQLVAYSNEIFVTTQNLNPIQNSNNINTQLPIQPQNQQNNSIAPIPEFNSQTQIATNNSSSLNNNNNSTIYINSSSTAQTTAIPQAPIQGQNSIAQTSNSNLNQYPVTFNSTQNNSTNSNNINNVNTLNNQLPLNSNITIQNNNKNLTKNKIAKNNIKNNNTIILPQINIKNCSNQSAKIKEITLLIKHNTNNKTVAIKNSNLNINLRANGVTGFEIELASHATIDLDFIGIIELKINNNSIKLSTPFNGLPETDYIAINLKNNSWILNK